MADDSSGSYMSNCQKTFKEKKTKKKLMQSDAGWRRRQGGKMFSSHCHDSWHWRRPNPVEHGSRWAANVRQPAAESSQTRAKCASPWQTTITYKLTLLCVIKYNKRGHLLNALAHISVGFREHCVAACWSGCLGTICQPDGSKIQLQKYIYFFFSNATRLPVLP